MGGIGVFRLWHWLLDRSKKGVGVDHEVGCLHSTGSLWEHSIKVDSIYKGKEKFKKRRNRALIGASDSPCFNG